MKADNPPNRLIKSTSPYLLQHAYNPVDWFPWGEEALNKAKAEDKLLLVSIGYSACHWCHVMEHESFEDYEIAEVMNRFFVCVKVDREERPDIDQVYMAAVQLMTERGGWPLNCFALPDGRPVYGGTYFPKQQWKNILLNLAEIYKKDKPKFEDYAQQLTDGIKKFEQILTVEETVEFDSQLLDRAVANWMKYFDQEDGGPNRAPKFPMPNNYLFLIGYSFITGNEILTAHITLTLKKMAFGGIYDQIGGGFSRYSVDTIWKVPHFEKMLYDNAQLISLYSDAFKLFKDPVYKDVVYQTIEFINRELTGSVGNIFSALDADSEGVEGKFYIWTKEEIEVVAGNDFDLITAYFNINEDGYWEHNNYILLRKKNVADIATDFTISMDVLHAKISDFKTKLLEKRAERVRPGLDDKTLTSWNALMITAFIDAYDAFGEDSFLENARRTTDFVLKMMTNTDGGLNHNYKNGISNINGFLEDYSFFIQALIRMYQATFEINYLDKAQSLLLYAINKFGDATTGLFYFASADDAPLIARKMELQDNVIPSSNSQMAINLYNLGHYFENEEWVERSKKMLSQMSKFLETYPSGYSNWLQLWIYFSQSTKEFAVCGKNALNKRNELASSYLYPGTIIAGCVSTENVSLTRDRIIKDKTLIYFCKDRTCSLPVENSSEALDISK
ncbi:MAG: thioredoxin domain-containing protein [Bacteroidetes bacterium]|nr:thioredoxin domain-containing protein [Bacteroidota bacterium]